MVVDTEKIEERLRKYTCYTSIDISINCHPGPVMVLSENVIETHYDGYILMPGFPGQISEHLNTLEDAFTFIEEVYQKQTKAVATAQE